MRQKGKGRPVQFPVAIGVRLDHRIDDALREGARQRGLSPTVLARDLIARGLDVLDRDQPIRRRVTAVRDEAAIRAALQLLGEIGGNLQRACTALSAGGRVDGELGRLKADLRNIADRLRLALRAGQTA